MASLRKQRAKLFDINMTNGRYIINTDSKVDYRAKSASNKRLFNK